MYRIVFGFNLMFVFWGVFRSVVREMILLRCYKYHE